MGAFRLRVRKAQEAIDERCIKLKGVGQVRGFSFPYLGYRVATDVMCVHRYSTIGGVLRAMDWGLDPPKLGERLASHVQSLHTFLYLFRHASPEPSFEGQTSKPHTGGGQQCYEGNIPSEQGTSIPRFLF